MLINLEIIEEENKNKNKNISIFKKLKKKKFCKDPNL